MRMSFWSSKTAEGSAPASWLAGHVDFCTGRISMIIFLADHGFLT
jgi:hypothetical protein